MPKYKSHWKDKSTSEGEGNSAADALTHLGFGGGEVRALDYYDVEKVLSEQQETKNRI